MTEQLKRSNQERMLLGICGGIAERYGFDPTLVRLAFVALLFLGPGILVYLIGALVIPRAPMLPAAETGRVLQQSRTTDITRRP